MPTRWEGDDRGRGIADAAQLVPGASELVAAFAEPDWVAEQPELHLRPHVEEWCRRDGRLALTAASADEASAFVLECEWRGQPAGVGQVRAAVFSLIGWPYSDGSIDSTTRPSGSITLLQICGFIS